MKKWWFNSMVFKKELERRYGINKSMNNLGPIENTRKSEDPNRKAKNIHSWRGRANSSYSNGDPLVGLNDTFLVRDSNGNNYSIYWDIFSIIFDIENMILVIDELDMDDPKYSLNHDINSYLKRRVDYYLRSQIYMDPFIVSDSSESEKSGIRTHTESSDTESSDTESSDTESSDTESSDTESSDTEFHLLNLILSESSDTESSDTESSDTESSDTESSDTESSDTESSDTESSALTLSESSDTESSALTLSESSESEKSGIRTHTESSDTESSALTLSESSDTESSALTLSESSESEKSGIRTHTESSDTESSALPLSESSDTESSDTESSDTESSDTESSALTLSESSDTESSDTESSDTESSDTESSDTESSDTESSDTESSALPLSESSDTESSDTESSDTESSDTGSSDTESSALPLSEGSNNPERPKDFSHLWVYCENCERLNYKKFFLEKKYICEICGSHVKMNSPDRIEISIDPGTWHPIDEHLDSLDAIGWDEVDECESNTSNPANVLDSGEGFGFNLDSGEGLDVLDSGEGLDVLDSGEGLDVLDSGEGLDVLDSGEGLDVLDSGEGLDVLDSGEGLDVLDSGEEEVEEVDDEPYTDRLASYQSETGLTEAVQTGVGLLNGIPIAMAVMDFRFMGGSMGSVVGEKITRLIEFATNERLPLIIVCASGGARMQEGSLSLMQMAKISSALYDFQSNKKLFYISILASPTTGGVTASFGMLGDIIIAEPNAYIAFAGKRVIEQTLNIEVPEGVQETEYLFEKGAFDLIVPRTPLKSVLSELFQLHGYFPLN
nr:acetyl-CoA carboxylase subunit [Syringa reticulata]